MYRRRYLSTAVLSYSCRGTRTAVYTHHTTCTCMHYDSNLITKCIIACRSTSRYHARYSCIHTCKFSGTRVLSSWPVGNWRIAPARWLRAGFRKFSGKKLCIAARAGSTVYPPWIQIADIARSIARWIRTSSRNKFGLALLHDEVRNLIFDDPAEL